MKPWKKISEKIIHPNRFRSFRKVTCRLPNKRRLSFYLLLRGSIVCALVLTKKRQLVIAKQFRLGPQRILYELPGGRVDKGESPRHAIIREVLEETGYRGTTRFIAKSTNDAWSVMERHHFVITNAKRVADPAPDDGEAIEVVELPLPSFLRRLHRGDLTDAETAYRGLEYLKLL